MQVKSDPKNFSGFKGKKLETKGGFGSLIIAALPWIILSNSWEPQFFYGDIWNFR